MYFLIISVLCVAHLSPCHIPPTFIASVAIYSVARQNRSPAPVFALLGSVCPGCALSNIIGPVTRPGYARHCGGDMRWKCVRMRYLMHQIALFNALKTYAEYLFRFQCCKHKKRYFCSEYAQGVQVVESCTFYQIVGNFLYLKQIFITCNKKKIYYGNF